MNYLEKNAAYLKLQNGDFLEKDTALLARLNPKSKLLSANFFDDDKARKEILFALLDVATEEEVIANRNNKRIIKTSKGQTAVIVKKKSRHSKKHKR